MNIKLLEPKFQTKSWMHAPLG